MKKLNYKGFTSMLGLILAMGIICIMAYIMFKFYFKPVPDNDSDKAVFKEAGIDTSNYQAVFDSAKSSIAETTKKLNSRLEAVEDVK